MSYFDDRSPYSSKREVIIISMVDVSVASSPLLPEHLCSAIPPHQRDLVHGPCSGRRSPMTAEIEKAWGPECGKGLLVWPSPGSSRSDMHRPFNRQFAKHMPSSRPDSTEPNQRLGCVHNRTSFILARRRTTTTSASRTRSLLSTNDSSWACLCPSEFSVVSTLRTLLGKFRPEVRTEPDSKEAQLVSSRVGLNIAESERQRIPPPRWDEHDRSQCQDERLQT